VGALARGAALAVLMPGLASCDKPQGVDDDRPAEVRSFPRADRKPAPKGTGDDASEATRDSAGEARTVMALAQIKPGMTVADIGAGEGYYTVRLSRQVGKNGRVLAEDIDQSMLEGLGDRVQREQLDNISIRHGAPEDPRLPASSFDRIFMVHMYHEVKEPYAFLWNVWPALRPGGRVVIVDRDLPTARHGMPPALLFCEMGMTGYRLTQFLRKPAVTGYYAEFEAAGRRPEPSEMRPCREAERSAS